MFVRELPFSFHVGFARISDREARALLALVIRGVFYSFVMRSFEFDRVIRA